MKKLKAAFVLLPDVGVQNRIRASVLRLHHACDGHVRWMTLTPHVSLKQAFGLESLQDVERYFDDLAAKTRPLRARLGQVELRPPPPNSDDHIVWASVTETEALRSLHDRLNEELVNVVENPSAQFDGADYRFHLTLAFIPNGQSQPTRLPELSPAGGESVNFSEIAMFVYDGLPEPGWQGMTYKVVQLRGDVASPER
jgi:2'-5' RNA ligase